MTSYFVVSKTNNYVPVNTIVTHQLVHCYHSDHYHTLHTFYQCSKFWSEYSGTVQTRSPTNVMTRL